MAAKKSMSIFLSQFYKFFFGIEYLVWHSSISLNKITLYGTVNISSYNLISKSKMADNNDITKIAPSKLYKKGISLNFGNLHNCNAHHHHHHHHLFILKTLISSMLSYARLDVCPELNPLHIFLNTVHWGYEVEVQTQQFHITIEHSQVFLPLPTYFY